MRLTNVSGYALQGRVLEKRAPKQNAENFYVQLHNESKPVWFAVEHFSKFEPLDEVGVVDSRGSWVRPEDTVVVIRPAAVPVQEVRLGLGYVSNPRNVDGQYWYMFKLQRWHRCHYDVAARYWLGDTSSQDSLLAADYYALLGVEKDAPFPDIKVAWKQMITEHHPDKWPVSVHGQTIHDHHARLASRINAARDCLTDVGERERYDRQRQLLAGPQQEEVRAWPGRGFGTLRARVEDRASVVLVKEILSWEPERFTFEGTLSLDQARIWGADVRFKVPIIQGLRQVGQETLAIPMNLLSRDLVRAVERRQGGDLKCRLQGIRTGVYSMAKKSVFSWIRVQEVEWAT